MIRKSMPSGHDPMGGYRFSERSCSNKKIERDDDSKKSHPALGLAAGPQVQCVEEAIERVWPTWRGIHGAFERYVVATVLESVVVGLVLGLGLESGILGLGLGRTMATFSVLASCRLPLTILPASFEMTGVESAGGVSSNE